MRLGGAAMKKILWIILLVVVAYLAWRWWRGPSDAALADRGQDLFYDRVWVDHLPTSQTDTFDIFAAVTEQPIGVFDHRPGWEGPWGLFRHEGGGGGEGGVLFPPAQAQRRLGFCAGECKGEKEFGFLLQGSGG